MEGLSYRGLADLELIRSGWKIAMACSKDRLVSVHGWSDSEVEKATNDGRLMLETISVFVHCCIKSGQYRLPAEFWRILYADYGIVLFPSAFTEEVNIKGVNTTKTFTQVYAGHIAMYGGYRGPVYPPPCPFQILQEPPPAYEK
ncbi:hypothetical protein S7711_05555 [Stachybotrys chartarum IBT 7711]|uniref:Uncharacterized protein n=1 Tax=Stachybotrys chartarum (strain CBS 109288 / IBT 7711) TaxID=1280523 RepID=A0A084AK96_STACB|nr:hypothetical protein S7711_05555 [Stachybotrys chartarum IBT 7711]KFA54021.1 hypothetical protein S40293_01821 [Stachybotrys chartarum IBT 40293]KFA81000.1 hypothetical protein S40288_00828 [Stachybotrys chartarum IBT 40288]